MDAYAWSVTDIRFCLNSKHNKIINFVIHRYCFWDTVNHQVRKYQLNSIIKNSYYESGHWQDPIGLGQTSNMISDQESSGSGRPRRPGSLKPSFPSPNSSRKFLFSSTAFVVGEQTSGIQSNRATIQGEDKELGNPRRRVETCLGHGLYFRLNDWARLNVRGTLPFPSAVKLSVSSENAPQTVI